MDSVEYVPRFKKPPCTKVELYTQTGSSSTTLLPTRHLYIAGMGSALGHTASQVREIMTIYGELDEDGHVRGSIDMPSEKRFCYVSYKQVTSAENAMIDLKTRSLPTLHGATVGIVQYAQEITPNDIKGAVEPEDVASTDHVIVNGCRIWEEWITPEVESELLREIDNGKWEESLKRRVQHYGFPFNYKTLMLDYTTPTVPISETCAALAMSMHALSSDDDGELRSSSTPAPAPLTQLTVNEYFPGQGIASHIDTKNCFGPHIFVLNLGSGIVMRLQYRGDGTAPADNDNDHEASTASNKKNLWLPRRSLLLLGGDARYSWSHGISPRYFDKVSGALIPRERRVSLTFRQALIPGEMPGWSIGPSHVEIDHVFRVYDNIAVHWNHTRGKRKVHWHRVKSFLEALPKGSLIADIGSGDGKYFGVNPGIITIGCDRSWTLLQVSKETAHETFCCDAVKLPLHSDTFDATICVAVLHHLASKDRRVAAVRELVRITRPGGRVLLQAWALEQGDESRHLFEEQDVLVPWRLQQRFFQAGQSEESPSVAQMLSPEGPCEHVEEKEGHLVFQRFCHVYKEGELEEICSYVPQCRVVESGWDRGNWVIEIEKVLDERLAAAAPGPPLPVPNFEKRK